MPSNPINPLDALPIGIIMFVGTVASLLWRKYGRRRAREELPALAGELGLSFAPSPYADGLGRISGRRAGYEVFVDPEESRALVVRLQRAPELDWRSYSQVVRTPPGWVSVASGDRDFDRFFPVRIASEQLARHLSESDRPSRYLQPFAGSYGRHVRALTVNSECVKCEFDFGNPPYIPAGAIRTLLPACIALAEFVDSKVPSPSQPEAPEPSPLAVSSDAPTPEPAGLSALIALGAALQEAGRSDDATLRFRQALEREPENDEVAARLLCVLRDGGRIPEAIEHARWCLQRWEVAELRSVLVRLLPYLLGQTDAAVLREARSWERAHAAPLEPLPLPFRNAPDPQRRLRVGYVAGQLREDWHRPLLEPLLRHHDLEAVEVSVYAEGATAEAGLWLHPWVDQLQETSALSDEELASRIRQDAIDVLVDLTLHGENGRLLAFARRPAPVQLCWLAYAGTTGLSAMGYRLTDPHLDPPCADPSVYAERSLVLPDSFWCYSPSDAAIEPGPLPALSAGFVTFGCFGDLAAINDRVLELWALLLRRVEGARLLLSVAPGDARTRIASLLERAGVERQRISFVELRSREERLAAHRQLDVCLDTFPCSGTLSSLDAFWMGVPVVTLEGNGAAARSGVSLAINLKLPEWIAGTPADYVDMAARWTCDWDALGALRAQLRSRLEASPLMDGARFARNVEAAYRRAWHEWTERGRTGGSLRLPESEEAVEVGEQGRVG